ncbi:hypothetical protein PUN28_019918 [Cardiocondyla obscurior]|uniref:Uncharacterized protein n=1 Tax=Cardiocondyla obscurior TaxID=286306 RepID=A0AAW2E848_9HYME
MVQTLPEWRFSILTIDRDIAPSDYYSFHSMQYGLSGEHFTNLSDNELPITSLSQNQQPSTTVPESLAYKDTDKKKKKTRNARVLPECAPSAATPPERFSSRTASDMLVLFWAVLRRTLRLMLPTSFRQSCPVPVPDDDAAPAPSSPAAGASC